jgi:Serine carboxypeptidase S28
VQICTMRMEMIYDFFTFSGLEAIYIEGTAHCANMYPEKEDDPQQLKQARSAIQPIGDLKN